VGLLTSFVHRARSRQAAHVSLPSVAFGSQVRSYTLQPEARVKDARTGVDVVGSAAVHTVLDGDIDRRGHLLLSDDVF
jgi:peptide chain release factor 2